VSENKPRKEAGVRADSTQNDFQQTTRRYVPEDRTLRNHRCENLKSYVNYVKQTWWVYLYFNVIKFGICCVVYLL
jgi:hypothetical protein